MRRFENQAHDEFWEVWIEDGRVLCHRFGRLGTRGLVGIERFPTDDEATRELERRMADRVASGFVEANLAWGAGFPVDDPASTEETIAPDVIGSADEWEFDEPSEVVEVDGPVLTIQAQAPAPPVPPEPEVAAAVASIETLCAVSGRRSWLVARVARRARSAVRRLGVVDLADVPELLEALDRAVRFARAGGRRRLPVSSVRQVLSALEPSAAAPFVRALDGLRPLGALWKGEGP